MSALAGPVAGSPWLRLRWPVPGFPTALACMLLGSHLATVSAAGSLAQCAAIGTWALPSSWTYLVSGLGSCSVCLEMVPCRSSLLPYPFFFSWQVLAKWSASLSQFQHVLGLLPVLLITFSVFSFLHFPLFLSLLLGLYLSLHISVVL